VTRDSFSYSGGDETTTVNPLRRSWRSFRARYSTSLLRSRSPSTSGGHDEQAAATGRTCVEDRGFPAAPTGDDQGFCSGTLAPWEPASVGERLTPCELPRTKLRYGAADRVVAELEFRALPAWERRASPVDERLAADDNLREPVGAVAPLHIDGERNPLIEPDRALTPGESYAEPPSSIRRRSEDRNTTSYREPGAGHSRSRWGTPEQSRRPCLRKTVRVAGAREDDPPGSVGCASEKSRLRLYCQDRLHRGVPRGLSSDRWPITRPTARAGRAFKVGLIACRLASNKPR
jgi:hypothetical protein